MKYDELYLLIDMIINCAYGSLARSRGLDNDYVLRLQSFISQSDQQQQDMHQYLSTLAIDSNKSIDDVINETYKNLILINRHNMLLELCKYLDSLRLGRIGQNWADLGKSRTIQDNQWQPMATNGNPGQLDATRGKRGQSRVNMIN
jgi:hypothetical protein